MKARVRNIGVVNDITVETDPIAFLTGANAQGKSTMIEAIGSTLCGERVSRWGKTAKEIANAVRDGQKAGVIRIELPSGAITARYPEGTIETEGSVEYPSPFVIGLRHFSQVDKTSAVRALTEALGAEVDFEYLRTYFVDHDINEKSAAAVWAKLEERGHDWDAIQKEARDFGQQMKGQWQAITKSGGNYGVKKAQGWKPENYDPDLDPPKEQIDQEVADAKESLEKMVGNVAVSDDEIKRLKDKVGERDAVEKDLEEAKAELATKTEEVEAAEKHRATIGSHKALEDFPKCPHCNELIYINKPEPHITTIEKPPEGLLKRGSKELSERQSQIAKADGSLSRLRGERGALEQRINRNQATLEECKQASKKLAQVEVVGERQQGDLAAARQRYDAAIAKQTDCNRYREAEGKRKKIENNAKIQAALSPEGVRQKKTKEAIEAFNEELSNASAAVGLSWPVQIDEGVNITIGEHPYSVCAESWQWRADFLISFVLAQRNKAPAIVVDRLDLLQQQDRGHILKAIRDAGIPAVVAMMAGRRDKVPDVERAKLAKLYWIEDGMANA